MKSERCCPNWIFLSTSNPFGNTTIHPQRKHLLSAFQEELLRTIGTLPDAQHFYLTGGTALAEFYFGHRKSYDLDVFTGEKQLVVPFSRVAEQTLTSISELKVTRRFETFVEFECAKNEETVKVRFAYDSPYRFQPSVETELSVRVNDYDDIVVDKLLAFFGRTEPRDAIDVHFILQNENLWTLCERARQKDPGFDMYWLAIACQKTGAFPDDITKFPVEMFVQLDAVQMKNTFALLASEILKRIQPGR